MKVRTIAVAIIAAAALAVPASANAVTLIGSGSIAAQPVLTPLFAKYTKVTNGKVKFVYTANGGNAGVKDVQSGKSQFAGNGRGPLPSDAGTTYLKLYLDGLCIDVNKANTLKNITLPNLKNIYTGTITNWGDVPGSNLKSTISPVGRDTNGGTYNFFLQAVLKNQPPSGSVNALTADGLVANAVKQDPNAIGYVGQAWQGSPKMHYIDVNGTPCTYKAVKKLKYKLTRYIWFLVPTSNPNSEVLKFADWVRRSKAAGVIIKKSGAVPAFNKGF